MNQLNPIFRSLRVIEEGLQEKLTVETLAESIHLSKYHYQRLFREVIGESVMRYVTRRRLFLAAKDLAETDFSVLEIALRYGYDSHEGFTRSFKLYMGVTPTEYRKYHMSITSPKIQKEKYAMLYSKTTDEILRELNSLIVQTRETAAYTRENRDAVPISAAFYAQFWDFIAVRIDTIADELASVLSRITAIPQCPDEISARFLLLKALEDAVFQYHITAFQTRLTLSRAKPEHRATYEAICERYGALAQNAQVSSERIVVFFHELASLIFQDMRKNVQSLLNKAIEQGEMTAKILLNPSLPYSYIGKELEEIVGELRSAHLEDITLSVLEDFIFRLDIIASAAEMDVLRSPSHRELFEGIADFRKNIQETVVFFQGLSRDIIRDMAEEKAAVPGRSAEKKYQDVAFQTRILLFYLRGEIQKLEPYLKSAQRAALVSICERMDTSIERIQYIQQKSDEERMMEMLQDIYRELNTEADKLGIYGDAIRFIAKSLPIEH